MQRILGLLNQSNSLEHIVRLSNIETEGQCNPTAKAGGLWCEPRA